VMKFENAIALAKAHGKVTQFDDGLALGGR
jgi:hypothetical protein